MIHNFFLFAVFLTCVYASPIAPRQAVTAVISPSQAPPPGCTGSFPSVFGIAVMNISLPSSPSAPSPTFRKRQPPPPPIFTVGIVNQINDGQVQGGMHTASIVMITPIDPVTQIGDGQIQGPVITVMPEVQKAASSAATTEAACSNVPSPFPRLANSSVVLSKPPTVIEQACGISTRPSPAGLTSTSPLSFSIATASVTPQSYLNRTHTTSFPSTSPSDESSPNLSLVSCLSNSNLRLHLTNNNLYDALNRTGYIASNYQFQFDGPPQSGAIYTSGWSICPIDNTASSTGATITTSSSPSPSPAPQQADDGDDAGDIDDGVRTLALGAQTTFWQCLSGSFYNLYTENWAAQCSPVELRVVRFVDCDSQKF